MADAALQRRLLGQPDSRGPVGIMARGANVYNGASMSAHSGGGPQFGRPPTAGISQQENVQPNLRPDVAGQGIGQMNQGPMDLNPKPVNLSGAIQRRLLGS